MGEAEETSKKLRDRLKALRDEEDEHNNKMLDLVQSDARYRDSAILSAKLESTEDHPDDEPTASALDETTDELYVTANAAANFTSLYPGNQGEENKDSGNPSGTVPKKMRGGAKSSSKVHPRNVDQQQKTDVSSNVERALSQAIKGTNTRTESLDPERLLINESRCMTPYFVSDDAVEFLTTQPDSISDKVSREFKKWSDNLWKDLRNPPDSLSVVDMVTALEHHPRNDSLHLCLAVADHNLSLARVLRDLKDANLRAEATVKLQDLVRNPVHTLAAIQVGLSDLEKINWASLEVTVRQCDAFKYFIDETHSLIQQSQADSREAKTFLDDKVRTLEALLKGSGFGGNVEIGSALKGHNFSAADVMKSHSSVSASNQQKPSVMFPNTPSTKSPFTTFGPNS